MLLNSMKMTGGCAAREAGWRSVVYSHVKYDNVDVFHKLEPEISRVSHMLTFFK